MSVFVVFMVQIKDRAKFAEYQQLGRAALAGHSFKMLAGPAPIRTLEGPPLDEAIILEFETLEAAEKWYDSKEYQQALGVRAQPSVSIAQAAIVARKG